MKRCLILSCTQTKRDDEAKLPALDRYDGPTFRVVRKFLREADRDLLNVDIHILSARYGLIEADKVIEDYDQRMTAARASKLRSGVLEKLGRILARRYDEVFLVLGRTYMKALEGYDSLVPDGTEVIVSRAPAGKRLTELKRWLYRLSESETEQSYEETVQVTGRAVLRGQEIEAGVEEVLSLARQALAGGWGKPHNFRTWHALVDGEPVSTKWLASLLSGLEVSEFQASEARRVLGQLGVPVYRDE